MGTAAFELLLYSWLANFAQVSIQIVNWVTIFSSYYNIMFKVQKFSANYLK